jgi:hypothetical protein
MGSDTADNVVEPRTGGALLLDTLLAEGADLAFCVPGESYLACSMRSTTGRTTSG